MAFAGVDNADTTSFSIDWLDEGVGELYKKTTNTELTKNNENYSLAGGVFEVRDSSGKLYATMTTNTNGYAKLTGIPYGTYKVSEKTPPKGHAATDEVVTVVINSPRAKAVHFDNLAQSNPIHIAAYKADAEKSSSAQEVAVDTATEDAVPFIKYLLGTILAAYKDFEDRFALVETKLSALEMVSRASMNKIGRFTKQDIRELCPSISVSSIEGALRKLVASGELKREGTGKTTCYYRLK